MLTTPTIVLVHGAFADTAVWAPVAREVLDRSHTVFVLPVGNRGLFDDAAAVGSLVEQLACPVVLAGRECGGAVIGVAGAARNVVGLVFVAGYVLDRGESVGELQSQCPETELTASRVLQAHRSADGVEGAEMSVTITFFRRLLAAGVDPRLAGILTFFQRPLACIVVTEPASAEARSRLPGCGIFARADRSTNSAPAVRIPAG